MFLRVLRSIIHLKDVKTMFGQRLSELRRESKRTQEEVAKSIGVAKTTYASYEQGKRTPDTETQNKIADLFDVSLDYLHGRSNKKHYYDLTEKDKKDAAEQVEDVINGMTADINFYGEPMTDEGRAKLKASLQMALELAKQEAKKKFTPKKYRDGE